MKGHWLDRLTETSGKVWSRSASGRARAAASLILRSVHGCYGKMMLDTMELALIPDRLEW